MSVRTWAELAARTAWVDLADANNARLKLDETPTARASSFVATQAHYRLVAVSKWLCMGLSKGRHG